MHERHRLTTALVGGVDPADALDLITEPLDAEWRRLTCGEEVDDAAAPRDLTAATNKRGCLIAECKSACGHDVKGDAIPCTQEERLGAQVGE